MRKLVHPGPLLAFCVAALSGMACVGQASADEATVVIDPDHAIVGWAGTVTVTVRYDGTGVAGNGLRGFHLRVAYNDDLIYLNNPVVDVAEGDLLSGVGTTAFLRLFPEDGCVVIDCAILGPTLGAFGAGDLATLTFTGRSSGQGTSPLELVEVELRDTLNATIPSSSTSGEIVLADTPVEAVSWSCLKALFLP